MLLCACTYVCVYDEFSESPYVATALTAIFRVLSRFVLHYYHCYLFLSIIHQYVFTANVHINLLLYPPLSLIYLSISHL